MILTCCEKSKAHSRYTVSVMEKILISNFLIFENTFYVQEHAVAPPNVEVETTSFLRLSGRM